MTGAEIQRQDDLLQRALGNDMSKFGVMETVSAELTIGTQTTVVRAVVDTPQLEQIIAGIPGPPIIIDPWIKPAD